MSLIHRSESSGSPDAPVISSLKSCFHFLKLLGAGKELKLHFSDSLIRLLLFFFLGSFGPEWDDDDLPELDDAPEWALIGGLPETEGAGVPRALPHSDTGLAGDTSMVAFFSLSFSSSRAARRMARLCRSHSATACWCSNSSFNLSLLSCADVSCTGAGR